MTNPSDHTRVTFWDLPPHLPEASLFNIPKISIEVIKEFILVTNPIYEDKVPAPFTGQTIFLDFLPSTTLTKLWPKNKLLKLQNSATATFVMLSSDSLPSSHV